MKMRTLIVALVAMLYIGVAIGPALAWEDNDRQGSSVPESAIPEVVDLTVGVGQDGSPAGSGRPGVPCPVGNLSGQTRCTSGFGGVWDYRSCYQRTVLDKDNTFGYFKDVVFRAKTERLRNEHKDAEGNFEGAIIECATPYPCSDSELCLTSDYFWSPFSVGQASARLAALDAVARMQIRAPQIGLTGKTDDPESMQTLGLPTWLWASDPGESTTGPVTRVGTSGPLSVTATGTLLSTVWTMGDGTTITCSGANAAGTPYDGAYGAGPSPTCGHRYTKTSAHQPGLAYTVSVTANWEVRWSGAGQSGTIPLQVRRTTQLRVGEVQVIITDRGPGPG